MGESDQLRQAQGYQTEAYPQQGFDQGYAQNGQPVPGNQNGYAGSGPESYGQSSLGQLPGPGSMGSHQDAFGQSPYGQDPFGQNGTRTSYPPDAYSQNGFRPDGNGTGGYSQDAAYVGAGPVPPGGPPPGGGDIPGSGTSPRSGAPRSAQRPGRIRMVLYLLASVVGVVVIVLLVVHLTKTGSNSPSAGTSSAATGPAPRYVFTAASKAGPYTLNSAATADYGKLAESDAAPTVAQIKAKGAGQPGQATVAIYNLGSVTSPTASGFKGAVFVGYEGTFNPAAVIKYEQSQLTSTRTVDPGSHGGDMMCGYNHSTGSAASECLWVTTSTFGEVEYIDGETPVKYSAASNVAAEIRQAVEVPAG